LPNYYRFFLSLSTSFSITYRNDICSRYVLTRQRLSINRTEAGSHWNSLLSSLLETIGSRSVSQVEAGYRATQQSHEVTSDIQREPTVI